MKRLWISALLLHSVLACARDPFAPPLPPACQHTLPAIASWRLLGMIGRGDVWRVWLSSVRGEVVTIVPNGALPFPGWQIERLAPFQLTMSSGEGCTTQRVTWQIKGNEYEKNQHAAAVITPGLTGS